MKVARIVLIVLVAAALGGALAACSSSDDKTTATATKAAAGSPAATTAGQATTIEVAAKEFSFTPAAIDVAKGLPTTFNLTNGGTAPHTMSVYTDEKYTTEVTGADTGTVSGGKTGKFTVTFDKAGDLFFQCDIHTTKMRGKITVK